MNIRGFVLSLAALQMVCARAEMEYATPESQGVDSTAISLWIDFCEAEGIKAQGGFNGSMHGFVIVRHGKTIAEGSWAPQRTLDEPHMLYSHSKSFTSTAIGFLVDDGKLDLDTRLVNLLPEILPSQYPERVNRIRVRDLLTMNTGSETNHLLKTFGIPNWSKTFVNREFAREPGMGFRYDSDATYLLAVIAEKLSGKPMMEFLRERLFVKIGITEAWSTVSPEGVACGGWGMNMTTRELARFGQFYLQEGAWNGEQLLSRDWVRLATSRQTWCNGITIAAKTIGSGSDWNQGYGFQFWRCRHNAFRADGASGQFTIVMPDQDAVISISAGLGNMQKELNLIWQYLLPAFGKESLPENHVAHAALLEKCANLKLPLTDHIKADFVGMSGATIEKTAYGWCLVKDDLRLLVGDGNWHETEWHFTDDNVEPLFANCGTRRIAANGQMLSDGRLSVVWQMLGGVKHGTFIVGKENK